jgi:hypothetical protein
MSFNPAGTLKSVISLTLRKAVVKTSMVTLEADNPKETWIVTGPGPVTGLG